MSLSFFSSVVGNIELKESDEGVELDGESNIPIKELASVTGGVELDDELGEEESYDGEELPNIEESSVELYFCLAPVAVETACNN